MSDTNEVKTRSDFSKANEIVKTYFNTFDHAESRAYTKVFNYYTHPETKGHYPPEFVREVLDSLEKNIPIYGPVAAAEVTLSKYL